MTSPTPDTYLINGIDLRSYATRIETAEGLQDTPGLVGDDIPIAGQDGTFDPFAAYTSPRRLLGAGTIRFELWLMGVDPLTGVVPGGSSQAREYFARWDELTRLFHRRTLAIEHPRPDGTTRTAVGHLGIGAISPSRINGDPRFGRATFPIVIPSGVWEDGTTVDTGLITKTSGSTIDLGGFAGCTAPCPCAVRVGAGNNPVITLNSRVWAWDAVITAGRQVFHDPATGLTTAGAGTAWTPGYTPLRIEGQWNHLEVDPSDPSFLATVTTGGGSIPVQITGKRLYRTS